MLFKDEFTDTDGILISAHNAEWRSIAGTFIIINNEVVKNADDLVVFYYNMDIDSDKKECSCDIKINIIDGTTTGIILTFNGAEIAEGYLFSITDNNNIRLKKNGNLLIGKTYTITTTTYNLKLIIHKHTTSITLEGYVNNVLELSFEDNTPIPIYNKGGLYYSSETTNNNAYDNFIINNKTEYSSILEDGSGL